MDISYSVVEALRNAEEFEFSIPKEEPNFCPFAQEFSKWTDILFQVITKEPSVIAINQAKVQLVDKYFSWFIYVPKNHRFRLGMRGHTCIFQVFVDAYVQIKEIELSITPPLLYEPPPPQIAGIFLGEHDED